MDDDKIFPDDEILVQSGDDQELLGDVGGFSCTDACTWGCYTDPSGGDPVNYAGLFWMALVGLIC